MKIVKPGISTADFKPTTANYQNPTQTVDTTLDSAFFIETSTGFEVNKAVYGLVFEQLLMNEQVPTITDLIVSRVYSNPATRVFTRVRRGKARKEQPGASFTTDVMRGSISLNVGGAVALEIPDYHLNFDMTDLPSITGRQVLERVLAEKPNVFHYLREEIAVKTVVKMIFDFDAQIKNLYSVATNKRTNYFFGGDRIINLPFDVNLSASIDISDANAKKIVNSIKGPIMELIKQEHDFARNLTVGGTYILATSELVSVFQNLVTFGLAFNPDAKAEIQNTNLESFAGTLYNVPVYIFNRMPKSTALDADNEPQTPRMILVRNSLIGQIYSNLKGSFDKVIGKADEWVSNLQGIFNGFAVQPEQAYMFFDSSYTPTYLEFYGAQWRELDELTTGQAIWDSIRTNAENTILQHDIETVVTMSSEDIQKNIDNKKIKVSDIERYILNLQASIKASDSKKAISSYQSALDKLTGLISKVEKGKEISEKKLDKKIAKTQEKINDGIVADIEDKSEKRIETVKAVAKENKIDKAVVKEQVKKIEAQTKEIIEVTKEAIK